MSGVTGNGGGLTPQGQFAQLARDLDRGALVTIMRGPNLGARMLVRTDGSTDGTLGDPALDRVAATHADERVDVVHARGADLTLESNPVVGYVLGAQPDCIHSGQARDLDDPRIRKIDFENCGQLSVSEKAEHAAGA